MPVSCTCSLITNYSSREYSLKSPVKQLKFALFRYTTLLLNEAAKHLITEAINVKEVWSISLWVGAPISISI
jgi:hypothetical protein